MTRMFFESPNLGGMGARWTRVGVGRKRYMKQESRVREVGGSDSPVLPLFIEC